MTSSFTEIQALPGKPPYPKKDGVAPDFIMNFLICLSISWVVTPGVTISRPTERAAAVIFPATRMSSISRGVLTEIMPLIVQELS